MWLVFILLSLWPSVSADFDKPNRDTIFVSTEIERCFDVPNKETDCILTAMRTICSEEEEEFYNDCEMELIEQICGKQLEIAGGDYPGCLNFFNTANLNQIWNKCMESDKDTQLFCFFGASLSYCDGQFGCVLDTLSKICSPENEDCKRATRLATFLKNAKACRDDVSCVLRTIYNKYNTFAHKLIAKKILMYACTFVMRRDPENLDDCYKRYEPELLSYYDKKGTEIPTPNPSKNTVSVTPSNEPKEPSPSSTTTTDQPSSTTTDFDQLSSTASHSTTSEPSSTTTESNSSTSGISSTVPVTLSTEGDIETDSTTKADDVTTSESGDEDEITSEGGSEDDKTTPKPTKTTGSESSLPNENSTASDVSNTVEEEEDTSTSSDFSTTEDLPIIQDDYETYADLNDVEEEEENSASFYSTLEVFLVFVVTAVI